MLKRLVLILCCCGLWLDANAQDPDDFDLTPSTAEQIAALTGTPLSLIAGKISPISGSIMLRETDLVAHGAQPIIIERFFYSPLIPTRYDPNVNRDEAKSYSKAPQLGGWSYLKHMVLTAGGQDGEYVVTTAEPNGLTLRYLVNAHGTRLLSQPIGMHNVGPDGSSGRYHPRNTRIQITPDQATVTVNLPSGVTRIYSRIPLGVYVLRTEILGNGKRINYEGQSGLLPSRIYSTDREGRYVYASVTIESDRVDSSFVSNTGLTASYTCERRRFDREWKEGRRNRIKVRSTCDRPVLSKVSSPFFRDSHATYSPRFRLEKYSGKSKLFQCHWEPQQLPGGPEVLGLGSLLEPVAKDGAFVTTHDFEYSRGMPRHLGGWTKDTHADGASQVYHYSRHYLITRVENLDPDGSLRYEERFTWSPEGYLTSRGQYDSQSNSLLVTTYENDEFGNPIREQVSGDLCGYGDTNTYSITRVFCKNGRHLLIRETEENGLSTEYGYVPGTSLPSYKLVYDGQQILQRYFWKYDESLNLIQMTEDDGASSDRASLDGVTERRWTKRVLRQTPPFIHMVEWEEKWGLNNGQDLLLRRTHFTYDSHGRVAKETVYDANGALAYATEREYDEAGNVLRQTNPLGQEATHAYDARSRRLTTQHFCGTLGSRMRYDSASRLIEKLDSGYTGHSLSQDYSRAHSYSYDHQNRMDSETNCLGHTTDYSYDSLTNTKVRICGPPITTADGSAVPVISRQLVDGFGRVTSRIDPCGHATNYTHNARGQTTSITHPDGTIEELRYYLDGTLEQHVSQTGLITRYHRDALGRTTAKVYISPEGDELCRESFRYSGFSLIEETDRAEYRTTYRYDGAGREVEREREGRIVQSTYDAMGRLAEERHLNDDQTLVTRYTYDTASRLIAETQLDIQDGLLNETRYGYDVRGNRRSIQRAIDNSTLATQGFVYDSFDRLVQTTDALGNVTSINYDETSINPATSLRQLTRTKRYPSGRSEEVTFDALDLPILRQTLDGAGSPLSTAICTYDPCGNLTERQNEDRITRWRYDHDSHVIQETLAAGTQLESTTLFSYTPTGKLSSKTKPSGESIHYGYDSLNNLASINSTDCNYGFTYDPLGRLVSTFDQDRKESTTRLHDPHGNVLREKLANGHVIEKTYDSTGRPLTLTLPDRTQIHYSYDPLRIRAVHRYDRSGNLQYEHLYQTYDLLGQVLSEQTTDGSITTYQYDVKGRPTKLSSRHFTQSIDSFDSDDCPTLLTERDDSFSLDYDGLRQLTSEPSHSHTFSPLFDPVTRDQATAEVNALNQLVSLNDMQCAYDADGRLTHKNDFSFTYDSLDRLIEASAPYLHVDFTYDPLGRRLTKRVKDGRGWLGESIINELYFYDGKHDLGATNENGTLTQARITAAHRNPVAIELGSDAYAPTHDLRGNIRRLTAIDSGLLADSYQFTSFGTEILTPSLSNPWRFFGKRTDDELGLVYFGKRYYDPSLARWLTPDPIGIRTANNLYAYCLNNPFVYCDPDGDFIFLLAVPLAPIVWSAVATTSLYAAAGALIGWGVYEANQYADRRARQRAFENVISYRDNHSYYNTKTDKKKKKAAFDHSERPAGVPDDWELRPSDKNDGSKWVDPNNPHNSVRQMPANPKSPYESQNRAYVVHQRHGQTVDIHNNPVPRQSAEAHIAAEEFIFKP